ncbi:MAG: hypothetical protein AB8B69_25610 [Chitinophagales bacterium]
MIESDIKLEIFRTIDKLTGNELQKVYQLLMDIGTIPTVEEVSSDEKDMEAAYQEMADDEEKGIRKFDELEKWDLSSKIVEDNPEECDDYVASLSKEEYSELEIAYKEMADDEKNGLRNLDW